MAVQKTVYDHIAANNIKTLLLVLAMPILLLSITYLILVFVFRNSPENWQLAGHMLIRVGLPVGGIALLWGFLSYFMGDKMMLGFAGAQQASNDAKHKKIYRAVENVAVAAGLPMPKVYLIKDDSLNAFATGHSPQTASVALTTGIVEKLEPLELEAVIAHEMGHIGNRDIRLNLIIITGLGVCAMLAELLFRVGSSNSSNQNRDESSAKVALLVMGIALFFFNLIVAPIMRLAISRTREYAADATAAYITRNPLALASALRKISEDARVEVLDKSKNMSHACIYDPLDPERMAFFGSTHPPIEKRIERLNQMAGLF